MRGAAGYFALALAAGTAATGRTFFSVAPMMAHTHRHFRSFFRILSSDTVLFTEMISADQVTALAHSGDAAGVEDLLGFAPFERPDVLQLGGRDPRTLHAAAHLAAERGYQQINLNCGCPSSTVATTFASGAALMLEPEHTAECCAALADAFPGNVSVKCRVGVDGSDDAAFLHRFIDVVSRRGGVAHFQVHARKALLGAGTIANREVPPLQYDRVHRLAVEFPHLAFELNGGVKSPTEVVGHLAAAPALRGVMVGRAVVNHPYLFVHIDRLMRGLNGRTGARPDDPLPSRGQVLAAYAAYCEAYEAEHSQEGSGRARQHAATVAAMLAPAYNLFTGEPACEPFRRGVTRMLRHGVASPAAILRAAARDLPDEALHGRVGEAQEMDATLVRYDKHKKSTRPLTARIV